MRQLRIFLALAVWSAAICCAPARLRAQTNLFDGIGLGGSAQAPAEDPVTIKAVFTAEPAGRTGTLYITATIDDGWHIYSITQPPGGPIRSNLKLGKNEGVSLAGDFQADPAPRKHVDDLAFPGLTLEEHEGTVTWAAPLKFAADVDVQTLQIAGKVYAQSCNAENCNPPKDYPFSAVFAREKPASSDKPAPAVAEAFAAPAPGEFQGQDVKFHGSISPKVATPGGKVRLSITAEPAEGWHIYALSEKPASSGSKPTLLVLTQTAGLVSGPAVASDRPMQDPKNAVGQHDGKVTWTVELKVPRDANSQPIEIEGLLGYQVCEATRCNQPAALAFSGKLAIGPNPIEGSTALSIAGRRKYRDVEDVVKDPDQAASGIRGGGGGGAGGSGQSNGGGGGLFDGGDFQPVGVAGKSNSLFLWMSTGFLAGLILNIMPCVLPVIGLKLLSFVEQSGHNRGQAFLLNVWYSLGIITVFLVLATLPVAARLWFNTHFAWGQQFAYDPFNITLTAIVFVMALSFLGVWEIPIPGFVGGGKAGELAAKEGFSGAFAKGAITTVLATPCGGPLLAPALGYAVTEPPLITYAMFASIGLGMASPYLLIGAFPRLIRFLPKPGAWMDTFKQMMGFVLLGTVVLLMSFIRWPALVPTLALLMGLWAGCWWIGRTPLYAELPVKARAWAAAVVFALLVGVMSFRWIGPRMEERFDEYVATLGGARDLQAGRSATAQSSPADDHHLPWRRFSNDELHRLTAEGKTVMVDFTADWCLTCKTLEATVLNTEGTKAWVTKNGVITMVADMTRWPEAESDLLSKLTPGSSIPVLAIFPAGRPNRPIVLTGFYTQTTLFEKLKEAGASKGAQAAGDLTAMNGR